MSTSSESFEWTTQDRVALRSAGLSVAHGGGDSRGPQVDTEASLEAGKGHEVGPDLPVQDSGNGCVIYAAERFRRPQASVAESPLEVDCQEPGGFDSGVGAGGEGPVVDQLGWGQANWSGHGESLKFRHLRCVSSSQTPDLSPAGASSAESKTVELPVRQTVGSNQQLVGDPVSEAIDSYVPTFSAEIWEAIGPFVREAVRDCDLKTRYSAQELMVVTARHVHWCWTTGGLELARAVIFRREVIGEYIARGCPQMTRASAGNRRSQLLRMSELLLPPQDRVDRLAPMPTSTALSPYTQADLVALRSWASGLNTHYRQVQAHLLLSLGLGAGMSNAEILAARSCHLHVDSEGALIEVVGSRPRIVPVLATWEEPLVDFAKARPLDSQQFIFRPRRTSQNNHTIGNFVDRTRPGLVKPTAQRMRVTWIVTHLIAGSPLAALVTAAGVDSLEALTRYLQFVPGKELTEIRAQFRSATTGTDPT